MSISDKLTQLRKSANLNKKNAAEKLKIPYSTYCNYETGYRSPNSEVLKSIAHFYNTTVDNILGIEMKTKENIANDIDSFSIEIAHAFQQADPRIQNAVCALLELPIPNEELAQKNA